MAQYGTIALLLLLSGCDAAQAQKGSAHGDKPTVDACKQLLGSAKHVDATKERSPRERCIVKQKARLDACAQKPKGERPICEAVARELLAVCDSTDPGVNNCATKKCDPDCKVDSITCGGEICAAPNAACDSGPLFDCRCKTTGFHFPDGPYICGCSGN